MDTISLLKQIQTQTVIIWSLIRKPIFINSVVDVDFLSAIYKTYQRLGYRFDNAIYEFIDNSTQNFFDKILNHDPSAKLNIHITWDRQKRQLVIQDDAHGMELEELTRAILWNQPPPDKTGISEYGMGLKMAACWL